MFQTESSYEVSFKAPQTVTLRVPRKHLVAVLETLLNNGHGSWLTVREGESALNQQEPTGRDRASQERQQGPFSLIRPMLYPS